VIGRTQLFSQWRKPHTHTHTHTHTLQNNGQQYEQGIFLGPCVIGRLWLLGHWTTQKECDHWTIGVPGAEPVRL